MTDSVAAGGTATISRGVVQTLLDLLTAKNYEVVGPTVRDDAIVYDRIARLADLPAGWTDRQEAGRYRLERRDDGALFGYAVGPQSWKRFLHRPVETLWTMRKTEDGVTVESGDSAAPKFAFIGVRACELHAIAIQDRVLSARTLRRIRLTRRGAKTLSSSPSIAARPAEPASASRCTPGRRPTAGFDLALTELLDGDDHEFLVEVGSEAGAGILRAASAPPRPPTADIASGRGGRRANGERNGPSPGDRRD